MSHGSRVSWRSPKLEPTGVGERASLGCRKTKNAQQDSLLFQNVNAHEAGTMLGDIIALSHSHCALCLARRSCAADEHVLHGLPATQYLQGVIVTSNESERRVIFESAADRVAQRSVSPGKDILGRPAKAPVRTSDTAIATVRASGHQRMMSSDENDTTLSRRIDFVPGGGRDRGNRGSWTVRAAIPNDEGVQPPLRVQCDQTQTPDIYRHRT